ncbi:MAG: HlyD family efflux transporter periplasmic adaptor subunit [Burkholderiaceae bacterium]|nr:HlyD family efflux transporter periplasmic adaptor subunit [Burkholderiaceae bacterium]
MQIRRSWIIAAVATAAAVAGLVWAFAPRAIPIETARATQGHFETAIEEEGKTRVRDRYVVAAPLAGVLARVALREGDAVSAGQVVATLQPVLPPLYDERTLRELRARLATAQAEADRAQAQVASAEVALARAGNDLQRSDALARDGFVSAHKLDADRLAEQAARKDLGTALEGRRVAQHAVEQARAALSVVQRGGSADVFALRSPVSGRVMRVAQTSETPLAAGTPLLEIGDTRQLEVVAELLTTEALQAVPGSAVVIERWGGALPLTGRVRAVEPAAFTKVSALGVEEQRVKVLIDLTSPPEHWQALGDAYRVTVRIVTRSVDQALTVPTSAVFPLPGDAMANGAEGASGVFVVRDGRARLREVDVVARNSQDAWLRRGLQPGDPVIVYPSAEVRDGVRVAPRAP